MAKLSEIVIKTEAGGFEYISLQTFDEQLDMVYYGSPYDEAVSGKYRSNARGYRLSYSISYSKCVQPSQFRSALNNIVQDMQDGLAFVLIGETTAGMIKVVPDADLLHRVQYANQIGRYVPKITLTSFEIFDGYPVGVETIDWRYVDEGAIEFDDYITITDPGLLDQEEYGTIG